MVILCQAPGEGPQARQPTAQVSPARPKLTAQVLAHCTVHGPGQSSQTQAHSPGNGTLHSTNLHKLHSTRHKVQYSSSAGLLMHTIHNIIRPKVQAAAKPQNKTNETWDNPQPHRRQ